MLLTFCLLLFRLSDPANSQTTKAAFTSTTGTPPVSPTCVLVATPDYPVAAGQSVHLHCSSEPPPSAASFSWQRLVNQTWVVVSNESDVTLAEPNQSGLYRCFSQNGTQIVSPNHMVFIVAIPPTAAEDHLEVVAFVFSVLALAVSGAVLFWLGRQTCDVTLPTSNTAKDSPARENAPKVTVTRPDDDGDVYVNYSSTSHAYSDLDPTRMTVSSVYSTLS